MFIKSSKIYCTISFTSADNNALINYLNKIKLILLHNKNYIKFETEKLVFSPALKIAGSIDLFVTCKDGSYIIYDWKILSKGLSQYGFNNKCGILECTKHIQDSNYWHYALQLQIYEIILKAEGYIPLNADVKRILNVFTDNKFSQHEMPDLKNEAKSLIKWLNQV